MNFAGGRKPRTPPTLYVFRRGSPRKELPHSTKDFSNPRGRDWWLWRARDILRDSVYQIEWSWSDGAGSPVGTDEGSRRSGR